jgi:hypothetical protein
VHREHAILNADRCRVFGRFDAGQFWPRSQQVRASQGRIPAEPRSQAVEHILDSARISPDPKRNALAFLFVLCPLARIAGDLAGVREAAADLAPTPDGRTNLTLAMAVQPQGFAANMMLGVALKTMPNVERQVVEGIEATLTDLATELAKPESEWDPAAWKPPSLQR